MNGIGVDSEQNPYICVIIETTYAKTQLPNYKYIVL